MSGHIDTRLLATTRGRRKDKDQTEDKEGSRCGPLHPPKPYPNDTGGFGLYPGDCGLPPWTFRPLKSFLSAATDPEEFIVPSCVRSSLAGYIDP